MITVNWSSKAPAFIFDFVRWLILRRLPGSLSHSTILRGCQNYTMKMLIHPLWPQLLLENSSVLTLIFCFRSLEPPWGLVLAMWQVGTPIERYIRLTRRCSLTRVWHAMGNLRLLFLFFINLLTYIQVLSINPFFNVKIAIFYHRRFFIGHIFNCWRVLHLILLLIIIYQVINKRTPIWIISYVLDVYTNT